MFPEHAHFLSLFCSVEYNSITHAVSRGTLTTIFSANQEN